MAKFWEKLFGKQEKPDTEADTIPQSPLTAIMPVTEEVTKPLSPQSSVVLPLEGETSRLGLDPPQLIACCAQSVGRQRDHNEDALFSLTTTMACNGGNIPFGLYIVADGMGGHQHGEIASETGIRAMSEHILTKLYLRLISTDPQPADEPLREILQEGVQLAHEAILENVTGGGTTLTTIVVLSNRMTIAHVGDSRVYSVSINGRMKPLTRDHSLVRRLEELGQLTPEEAAIHPQRNVLYRALGQGEPFEPEIITAPLPQPGYLLVCSDGLWGVVPEERMGEIIKSAPQLSQACQGLVDAANAAGGPDNISAILVRLPE